MSRFFTSGFARKRAVTRENQAVTRGNVNPPDEQETIATGRAAGYGAEGSWIRLQDYEGRSIWCNSSSGDRMHQNIPGSTAIYISTPSLVQIAQPPPSHGPPLYVATPHYVYATVPHPFMPPPLPMTMHVVPQPTLVEYKVIGVETGKADKKRDGGEFVERGFTSMKEDSSVEGFKKNGGNYYVWEKFYDEKGKVVWINRITGKRTREDPYW